MSRRKRPTANVALGILVLLAFATTGYNLYSRVHREPTRPQRVHKDWRSYAAHTYARGADTALVTIVVFSDYSCAFCAELWARIHKIQERHTGAVSVVLRQYPLGAASTQASVAAVCAAQQDRLWEFSDVLFAHSDSLGQTPLLEYATQARIPDLSTFLTCLSDSAGVAIVNEDLRLGERAGVFVTPTFMVNEHQYQGNVWDFEKIVEDHVLMASHN